MIHFNNKSHLISLMDTLLSVIIKDVKLQLETKTQAALSKEMGVSNDTISRLANYGGVKVSLNTMLAYIDKAGGTMDINITLNNQTTNISHIK